MIVTALCWPIAIAQVRAGCASLSPRSTATLTAHVTTCYLTPPLDAWAQAGIAKPVALASPLGSCREHPEYLESVDTPGKYGKILCVEAPEASRALDGRAWTVLSESIRARVGGPVFLALDLLRLSPAAAQSILKPVLALRACSQLDPEDRQEIASATAESLASEYGCFQARLLVLLLGETLSRLQGRADRLAHMETVSPCTGMQGALYPLFTGWPTPLGAAGADHGPRTRYAVMGPVLPAILAGFAGIY